MRYQPVARCPRVTSRLRSFTSWGFHSLAFLIFCTAAIAQTEQCGTDAYHQQMMATNPSYVLQRQAIEAHRQQWLNAGALLGAPTGIIRIPVVFHVVYKNVSENLGANVLQSQIDVLNEDFRRLNPTATQTPPAFQGVAADCQIEFCLANFDPAGNPTTGITRTSTFVQQFSINDDVKSTTTGGANAWPSSSYLNVWVCDLPPFLLGYAAFPGGPANLDGIVLDYTNTGRPGIGGAPYDQGRTGTHEVGHWLDLHHIWGDPPGGCGIDDGVTDTPPQANATNGCGPAGASCGSTEMIQNYMDYTDDACMNLFTQGQRARMRTLFAPGGARESLLNSFGCTPPPPPDYQLNQAESTLTIDNVTAALNVPAVTDTCTNVPVTLSWSSSVGGPWEVLVSATSLLPATAGGITTLGGQILNVNAYHPTVFFFNSGGLNPAWTPFPGNASIPVNPGGVSYTLAAQQVILTPSMADGFALSQGAEMRVNTGGSPPNLPLGPVQNDSSVLVNLLGSGTNCGGFTVPFYGASYTGFYVSSNGRVTFGAADDNPQASTAAASSGPPSVGLWADFDPSSVGSISLSIPSTGIVTVHYTGLEYYGQAFSTSSFTISLDSNTGDIILDGLSGVVPNNATQFFQDMLIGISPGAPTAILSPTVVFAPGTVGAGTGIAGTFQTTIFDYTSGGFCPSLSVGTNRIIFTPNAAGNYDWSAF